MPKRYPPLSQIEVIQILEARAIVFDRSKGSHSHYEGMVRGKRRLVTVDNSIETYHRKRLKTIISQSGLTREEFYCSTKHTASKINKKCQL